jgi:hypothetical protein
MSAQVVRGIEYDSRDDACPARLLHLLPAMTESALYRRMYPKAGIGWRSGIGRFQASARKPRYCRGVGVMGAAGSDITSGTAASSCSTVAAAGSTASAIAAWPSAEGWTAPP